MVPRLPRSWSPCPRVSVNGVCRRCRQPGHVARECQRAWGGPTPGRPRSQAQASAEPSASGPAANAEDVGSSSPGDNSEMEVADSPLTVSVGADSSPPGSAPLPEAVDESVGDVLSGDEEVIAAASAVVIGSLSSPRRTRKRKPRADPPSSSDELPSKTVAVEVATPAQSFDQQQCGSQASPVPPSTPVSGLDPSSQPVVVLPPPPTGLLERNLPRMSPSSPSHLPSLRRILPPSWRLMPGPRKTTTRCSSLSRVDCPSVLCSVWVSRCSLVEDIEIPFTCFVFVLRCCFSLGVSLIGCTPGSCSPLYCFFVCVSYVP